jgi:acyl-CoA hydrolase
MIVGIRVEAENIQTGAVKHCNSSYFTMVAKNKDGTKSKVPGLILSNLEEIRRFCNCMKQIALKKEQNRHEEDFDYTAAKTMESLAKYNVQITLNEQ